MGLLTLANFRSDITSATGGLLTDTTKLDRFINLAYLDVTGAVNFESLTFEDTTQSTAVGVNSVNVPTAAQVVQLVRNTTTDNKLDWIPQSEYWRLKQATTGAPTKWTRQGTKIQVHPVPIAVQVLRIIYKKSPTILSLTTDVTVIPDIWDAAIWLIATHYAMLSRGEEARAMVWLQRAASYMQSRMTEESMHYARGLEFSLSPIPKAQG